MTAKQMIRAGILSCLLLITSFLSHAQFKVIGYMPSWQGDVNAVQYSKLTHINYAFLLPTSTGGLQSIDNPSKLQSLVSLAHTNGVKVLISVGGWNNGDDSGFETLAGNSTYRSAFVTNIMNFVNQYNLDGADIDWEYPDAGTSANNYVSLMTALATSLHAQGKLLTAAVVGTGGDGVLSSVFSQVDFLNLMAYDYNNYDHSTYTYASQSISYWKGKGLPAAKTVLGVPFYGRPSWESYAALIARGASPYADTYNGVGYNGITTIKSKTDLAYDQGGGIMIWELSMDATGTYSLLSAIHDEVVVKGGGNTGNKYPTVSITSPANNATFTAGATVSITATAADADGSVTKVEFYNGSTLLGTSTASPYSYSWTSVAAGSYSLTAKATDNGGAATTSSAVSITVSGSTSTGNCAGVATYQPYPAVYNAGDKVVYNGYLYVSLANGLYNVTPGTADYWWQPLGACSSSAGVANTTYETADSIPVTVYPNPVTGSTLQVKVSAAAGEQVVLELWSVDGTGPVVRKIYTAGAKGAQMISVDISKVPVGTWIVKLSNAVGTRKESVKLIRL